jgi:hypothetical protein
VVNYSVMASSLQGTDTLIVSSFINYTGDFNSYHTQVSPLTFDVSMCIDNGYFLYCRDDTTLEINGYDPVERNATIYPGWNLIGWSSSTGTTAKNLTANITGRQIVAKFNATTGDYDSYAECVSPDASDFTVESGSGYFLYTDATEAQTFRYGVET